MENNAYRQAALIWLKNNTKFDVTTDPLPANVELFIDKYESIMSIRPGVASESISGLSQSFNSGESFALLRQYARELIGAEYMKSDVRAIPALEKWTY